MYLFVQIIMCIFELSKVGYYSVAHKPLLKATYPSERDFGNSNENDDRK